MEQNVNSESNVSAVADRFSVVSESKNPLRFAAGVALVSIFWGAYNLLYHHTLTWNQMLAMVFSGSFLLAYILYKRVAWLIALVIFAGLIPMNLIIYYFISAQHRTATGGIFAILFWLACIGYTLWARSNYYAYIHERLEYKIRGEGHTVEEKRSH
jgi:hypothetical protein